VVIQQLFPHCSMLWVSDIQPKSFNLYNIQYIKKVIAKLYSFRPTRRSKITDKQ